MKNEKEIKELEKEYQEALERNRRAKEILNDLPDVTMKIYNIIKK